MPQGITAVDVIGCTVASRGALAVLPLRSATAGASASGDVSATLPGRRLVRGFPVANTCLRVRVVVHHPVACRWKSLFTETLQTACRNTSSAR